jgi:putative FmdB family regulatory protein
MPIYEYRCATCGFQEEYLQKISDAPLRDCPECHEPALRKMVTAAGFQLKGSGWYVTDFKGGTKPKAQEKPSDEAKPAKSDDAKPAASSEKACG